ncbi:MAG: cation:proton antiporter [Planctomycetes bacterium]|nr:cation:proton antiporter [Planctomycetota bacterium]
MLGGAIVVFTLVDWQGRELLTPELREVRTESGSHRGHGPLVHVLLTLTAVVGLGWVLGRAFRWVGQPPVIGEVVAGIALGPSVLGWLVPGSRDFLLPAASAPFLEIIAQFGIILYMFVMGLELNLDAIRTRTQATLLISHTGIVAPFVCGAVLALYLYPHVSSANVAFTNFALFMGVALSITAFPVLARILSDRKLQQTPLGVIALACAALNDATAWCLLAVVVGIAQARVDQGLSVLGMAIAFFAFLFLVVRPVVGRWLSQTGELTRATTAGLFLGMLVAAVTAEWIGIHAIFGAFLFGAIIPHDSVAARDLMYKLEGPVTVLLLPAFFALTGLRTQFGLVATVEEWLLCGVIIAVATVGKFGGTLLSARLNGLAWREATALGILMNTRGLMELIVLNIGLDLNIISPTLYSMMVVMALATTMATTPLLLWTGYGRTGKTG